LALFSARIDSCDASCHFFLIMQAIKIEATVEKEGELHLTNLPLHPTQRVEVIVLIGEENRPELPIAFPQVDEAAWQKLLETIRASEPRFSTLDEAMSASRGRP
jgi:hypothetical protein